jgi:hypothetical protein
MTRPLLSAVVLVSIATGASGCSVDVRETDDGKNASVDVRMPFTDVSVRTEADAQDTGLPIFPGAQVVRDKGDPGTATVSVSVPGADVRVVALNYETTEAPSSVVSYYRDAMKTHGRVVECTGDVDFKGSRIDCRRNGSGATQLAVGREELHRMVAVKSRGSGAEFALVYVQTQ